MEKQIIFHKGVATGYTPFGIGSNKSVKLVDGDKIGDVTFEAGKYTLSDIVRIVNEKSKTFTAREDDQKVKLATKHLTTEPPSGGNRHERRKAAALARRRA